MIQPKFIGLCKSVKENLWYAYLEYDNNYRHRDFSTAHKNKILALSLMLNKILLDDDARKIDINSLPIIEGFRVKYEK